MQTIKITLKDQTFTAALEDTPTAQKLWDALPIEGQANLWGEEIYFEIPLSAAQEPEARQEVPPGTIAFWPAGNAFCIFFGPTPVSRGDMPRAYSPVNVLGKITGDLAPLKDVPQGASVRLERAQE
jgi:uncharacterized protein